MDLISTIKELTLGPNFFKSVLQEKRNIPRIICDIKARGLVNGRVMNFRITDMSTKGLKVNCVQKLSRGLTFPLTVDTERGTLSDGDFKKATLQVKVAWCRKQQLGDSHTCGLLFVDHEENLKDSWVYYIFSEIGIYAHSNFQKRGGYRIHSAVPVTCHTAEGIVMNGTIQNIGIGGLLILCGEEFHKGEELDIAIGPFTGSKELHCRGRVVRVSFINRSYQWLVGIEFIEMDVKVFKSLGKLILSLMRTTARR
jgi:hypothetical protein